MHIKAITSKGITRLYIYETIYERDPVTGKGRTRSKLIEPLGRLDELQKVYDDPIAHFKAVCEHRTSAEKEKQKISLEIDLDDEETWDTTRSIAHKVMADRESWDKSMREFAAKKLTELANDISLNEELFARVKAVYEHPGRLKQEDRMLLEKTYKSFARNGAALSEADKEAFYKTIDKYR